jgi:hypothetical protein
MANRRANKKLRALTHARMAATGESYQRALSRVRAERAASFEDAAADLIECRYHGVPVTLATFQDPRLPRIVVMPRFELPHDRRQQGSPLIWMRLLQPRGVQ